VFDYSAWVGMGYFCELLGELLFARGEKRLTLFLGERGQVDVENDGGGLAVGEGSLVVRLGGGG
jgi:hypothetical protein